VEEFFVIGILSYIIGSCFMVNQDEPKKYKKYMVEFAKSYLTLLCFGHYLHSGLTYFFASSGLLAGHTRSIFKKFEGDTTEILSLGIIFAISPYMGLVLLLCFLILLKILKVYDSAVFATSFFLPALSFVFFESDASFAIAFIIFAGIALQFWPPFLDKKIKPVLFTRIAFAIAVMGMMILLFFNKYVYRGFGVQTEIIRQGPQDLNYVAITFDDGPNPFYTPYILDILKEYDVPATFFLIGKNAQEYPDIARRIVEEGHSIGNHTYSHKSLIPLSAQATFTQIKNAEKAIENATGVRPTLFRPPRGVYSSYAMQLMRDERYTMVLWDVSSEDWAELPPKKIVSNIVKRVKPGSIILLHDSGDLVSFNGGNRSATVQALPLIIENLREKGYDFVTIDQMILLSELMKTEEQIYESDSGESQAY